MKIERTIATFECDECGKLSDTKDQPREYPYSKGWLYLYRHEIKIGKDVKVMILDKHFCKMQCMKDYIEAEVMKHIAGVVTLTKAKEVKKR